MIVRRVEGCQPFKAVDGSTVVELIGLATTGTGEISLALAWVEPRKATIPHKHEFTEIYLIAEGEGLMHLGAEKWKVSEGDAILIPPGHIHHIENLGSRKLAIWCICTPAFTIEKTTIEK